MQRIQCKILVHQLWGFSCLFYLFICSAIMVLLSYNQKEIFLKKIFFKVFKLLLLGLIIVNHW